MKNGKAKAKKRKLEDILRLLPESNIKSLSEKKGTVTKLACADRIKLFDYAAIESLGLCKEILVALGRRGKSVAWEDIGAWGKKYEDVSNALDEARNDTDVDIMEMVEII